uniref:NF-kappa-B essential modulator NEMO N-terminal domain-containing protein n=1 Tax=Timema genevievae TaxID=629358 RepID=A0A7R9JSS5_TIMGE|nr:unnamed protein product [Timema genevievae]
MTERSRVDIMVKVNEKPEEKSPKHQDFGPQSFSNDGSFVVLEESSGACYMSTSMTTDLNPEEIQNKLHELLVENVELKDTLNQNNMAMRQQFHTLVKWQEEVLKVHQNHKEKFAETRDLIHKLRNENEELKKCIAEMKSESSTISIALEQQPPAASASTTYSSEPLIMASMGVTPGYTISNKACSTHSSQFGLTINEENVQIRLSAPESQQLDDTHFHPGTFPSLLDTQLDNTSMEVFIASNQTSQEHHPDI